MSNQTETITDKTLNFIFTVAIQISISMILFLLTLKITTILPMPENNKLNIYLMSIVITYFILKLMSRKFEHRFVKTLPFSYLFLINLVQLGIYINTTAPSADPRESLIILTSTVLCITVIDKGFDSYDKFME